MLGPDLDLNDWIVIREEMAARANAMEKAATELRHQASQKIAGNLPHEATQLKNRAATLDRRRSIVDDFIKEL